MSTNYTVTVGGGGAESGSTILSGNNGSNSVFSSITSTAGGGGGGRAPAAPADAPGGDYDGGDFAEGEGGSDDDIWFARDLNKDGDLLDAEADAVEACAMPRLIRVAAIAGAVAISVGADVR